MDSRTRDTHRRLHKQLREVGQPFKIDGKKALYPGAFGIPEEDIHCRCAMLQRARWALSESELQQLRNTPEAKQLAQTENFEQFKDKYLELTENSRNRLTNSSGSSIMKNVELPPETYGISSMSEETRRQIADAFDKLNSEYNIQLNELLTMPLKPEEKNVPFQFQPIRGENGELIKRIVINSDYNFKDTQEEFQARIMRNFNRGVLASNSVAGLIAHETAHVMTFQDVSTFSGYLIQNKSVAKQIVYGISGYADTMGDGAECIAEAFAAKQCGQPISEDAQALLDNFIERWRK